MKAKDKKLEMARKLHFEKDERDGIVNYKKAIVKSKGKEKKTYEKILPQEEHHLREIKDI